MVIAPLNSALLTILAKVDRLIPLAAATVDKVDSGQFIQMLRLMRIGE